MKSFLTYGARFLLTAVLLAWLSTQVEFGNVARMFVEANLFWLATGIAVHLVSVLAATWRWQTLLGGLGFRFRTLHLLRLVLSGAFFNMFLPSSVGGDVMKMVLLAPDLERREDAVATVLMDRVVGLAVTILVGLVAVLLLPAVWSNAPLLISLGLILLAFSVGVAGLFNKGLLTVASRVTPGVIWRRVGPPVLRVHESLTLMAGRPDVLLKAAAFSVLRQFAICGSVYCAGLAFGLPLGPLAYCAPVPIAIAITALPIAINGLGLQDNALLLLLGGFGLTATQALGISIFLHFLRYTIGLAGGINFALSRRRLPVPAEAPESSAAPEPLRGQAEV